MKMITKHQIKARFVKANWTAKLCKSYRDCRDGVAAIEFAFVAPIMIFMYFGLAEISLAISVDRKVSHSANVAGDLATQVAELSPDQMAEIMTATMMVLDIPESKRNSVKIELASYARDSDDNVVPMGVATFNGAYPGTFNAAGLDQRILSSSSGIVVARITYTYVPLKFAFLKNDIDLTETFLLKPRKSANVEIKDSSGNFNAFNCQYNMSNKIAC